MAPRRNGRHAFARLIDIDQILEVTDGNERQQLHINCSATIHDPASSAKNIAEDSRSVSKNHGSISNRRNRIAGEIPCQASLGTASSFKLPGSSEVRYTDSHALPVTVDFPLVVAGHADHCLRAQLRLGSDAGYGIAQ